MVPSPRHRARRERAFTLVELLVVVLVVAVLAAVAAASFLGQQDKAHDSAAQQHLTVALQSARAYIVDADDGYRNQPRVIAALADAQPQLTFQTYNPGDRVTDSQAPANISVQFPAAADAAELITLCARSDGGGFFCARHDRLSELTTAAAEPSGGLAALFAVEAAWAAGQQTARSSGWTQPDAIAALPSRTTPGSAGPSGTGTKGWDLPARGDDYAPPAKLPPSSLTPPTITGLAQTGKELHATRGTWAPENVNTAIAWQHCNAFGEQCEDLAGADKDNFTLTSADEGNTLRVRVTATNDDGSAQAFSAPTTVVQAPPAPPSYTAVRDGDSPAGVCRLNETGTQWAPWSCGPGTSGQWQANSNDFAPSQPGAIANDPDTSVRFYGTTHWSYLVPSGDVFTNYGPQWSAEVWAKPAAAGQDAVAFSADNSWALRVTPSGARCDMRVEQPWTLASVTGDAPLPAGEWAHLACVYDNGTLTLYVNGAPAASKNGVGRGSHNRGNLAPARQNGGWTSGGHFNGWLDELAFYQRALTAGQVTAHYQAAR